MTWCLSGPPKRRPWSSQPSSGTTDRERKRSDYQTITCVPQRPNNNFQCCDFTSSDLNKKKQKLLWKTSSSQKIYYFRWDFSSPPHIFDATFGRKWGSVDWQLFGWWPRGALSILTLAGRVRVSRSFYPFLSFVESQNHHPKAGIFFPLQDWIYRYLITWTCQF